MNVLRDQQPWTAPGLAELYDAFPFDDDIALYRELAAVQGGRVLEVACGTGRVLLPLVQAGFDVVGVDASEPMLALARRKLERCGAVPVRLVHADARTFDLGETFDLAIVAAKSFAYLLERREQQSAVERVAAHLRPGGLLAVDFLHATPAWIDVPDGAVRQDVAQRLGDGSTVARTETMVRTDVAAQVRLIRSAYEIIAPDGTVTKRMVEWPYRWTHRFEAEHLLERAGLRIEALYGGYEREPFVSESPTMLFLARASASPS